MSVDPLIARECPIGIDHNDPTLKERSKHKAPFVVTIIFFTCKGLGVGHYITNIIPSGAFAGIIAGGYVVYLFFGVFKNKTALYLRNSKSFS